MTISFCPNCWAESARRTTVCPHCGFTLADFEPRPYEEKLLRALRHPLREHRMMAIQVLGELRSRRAGPALATMLEGEPDSYEGREMIRALDRVGSEESRKVLVDLIQHRPRLIRRLVQETTGVEEFKCFTGSR